MNFVSDCQGGEDGLKNVVNDGKAPGRSRHECRHGTQECVRHGGYQRASYIHKQIVRNGAAEQSPATLSLLGAEGVDRRNGRGDGGWNHGRGDGADSERTRGDRESVRIPEGHIVELV